MIKESNNPTKSVDLLKIIISVTVIIAILVLLIYAVAGVTNVKSARDVNATATSYPRIGANLLEHHDFDFSKNLLTLDDEWEYYPGVLLSPADFANGIPVGVAGAKYVRFPHHWNSERGGNQAGIATYRSVIRVPEGTPAEYGAGVFTSFQHGAFTMYLNGVPVVSSGRVSANRDEYYFTFTGGAGFVNPGSYDGIYEIIIQVQGYEHVGIGLSNQVIFGSHGAIRNYYTTITSATGITTGAILVLIIYFILIYIRNRHRKEYLNIAIVSLCCLFLTITGSGSLLAYQLAPAISVHVVYTLEYISFTVGAYFATVHLMKKYINYRHITKAAMIFTGVSALLIIFLSTHYISTLRYVLQVFPFVLVAVALAASLRNAVSKKNLNPRFKKTENEHPMLEFISLLVLFGGLAVSVLGFTPWYGFSMISVFAMAYCFMQIFLLTERNKGVERNLTKLVKVLENRVAERTSRLADMHKEVQAANEVKNEFLTLMSNEIRTPMNAIIGISDLFDNEKLSETQRLYFKNIKETSHALLNLMTDVMDFSKIEAGHLDSTPETFNLRSFVENIGSAARYTIKGTGLNFDMLIDETLPEFIHGDEVRIKQVIVNVISNAVKYTREGSIKLEVKATAKPGNKEAMLLFIVTDTGIGINKENLEHMFNAFANPDVMKKRGVSGTGLRMTICKRLTDLLKGKLEVESEVGKGSVFKIYFPLVLGQVGVSEDTKISEKIQAGDAKVLLVEDTPINITVIIGIFAMHDIKPDVAKSGEEAFEMIQKKEYDLVFMDQFMPGMDGIETTQKIRALGGKYATIPIIALTANKIPGARDMMIFKGMTDYMAKPINQKELNNLLVRWLPFNKVNNTLGKFEEESAEASTVSKLPRELVEITELNCADALKSMDGNVAIYMKFLQRLIDEADEYIDSLYEYLKISDMSNYSIIMNGVKSLLYSIGAKANGDAAERLERAALEENIKYCTDRNTAFCDKLKWLVQRITLTLPFGAEAQALQAGKQNGITAESEVKQKLAGIMQNLSFSLSKSDNDGILKNIAALKALSGLGKLGGAVGAVIGEAEAQEYAKALVSCNKLLQKLLD
jgi:signal transduction histidine kinase/CheY-like chemotaxis protein